MTMNIYISDGIKNVGNPDWLINTITGNSIDELKDKFIDYKNDCLFGKIAYEIKLIGC